MKKINLRISELKHKKKITQQELADVVGVLFQTISKWENGSVMPDITYLPMLAEYFEVSVDQLIGIVPLSEETYSASKTGTKEFWEQKLEYLLRTRNNMWNSDYMEFLITKVWKIDKPVKVLDCGCGFGFLIIISILSFRSVSYWMNRWKRLPQEICFMTKTESTYVLKKRYWMKPDCFGKAVKLFTRARYMSVIFLP